MRHRIELKAEVEDEIYDAAAYIARDSPQRCSAAREDEDLRRGVRQLVYKSHRIIFVIHGQTVRILAVRHTARRNLEGT